MEIIKIRIKNQEEGEFVQKKFFERGIYWHSGKRKIRDFSGKRKFLYLDYEGGIFSLLYGLDYNRFEQLGATEIKKEEIQKEIIEKILVLQLIKNGGD